MGACFRGRPAIEPFSLYGTGQLVMTTLTQSQVEPLLYELCVRLKFCLPPADQKRLKATPPTDIEAYTDAVFVAKGMGPLGHPNLRKQVVACEVIELADLSTAAEKDPILHASRLCCKCRRSRASYSLRGRL